MTRKEKLKLLKQWEEEHRILADFCNRRRLVYDGVKDAEVVLTAKISQLRFELKLPEFKSTVFWW